MKALIIVLLPLMGFAQVLPPGKYLKVKDDGSGFELFTLNAVTSTKLTDTATSIRTWALTKVSDSSSALRTTINTKQNSLGYTPYNSTNPNNYISVVPAQTWLSITGKPNIPDSTPIYAAIALKSPINNPTFTGTVGGVTATMVGLGNVTNESKATIFANSALTGATTSTGSIGYTTGAGGTVVQLTNKGTTVVLNKITGEITLVNSALAAAAIISFTLTNSTIAATDQILLQHQTTGTFGAYTLNGRTAAGSAVITIRNNTSGSLSEAIVIKFTVIKSVIN